MFRAFIVVCLLLGSNAVPLTAAAERSALPSYPAGSPAAVSTDRYNDQNIPSTYELVAENNLFQLFVDKTSLAFIVIDKRSGYVWHSSLDDKQDTDRLNKNWTAFARSGISIDYLDRQAVSKRISITNSNTSIDVTLIDQGVQALVKFIDFSITIGVVVKLETSGVSVDVPFDMIKEESADYKLGMPILSLEPPVLTLYPDICSFQMVPGA
jgi:hypothetical protein